jgi:malonate transporter
MSVIHIVLPDFLLIAMGWLLLNYLSFSADFFRGMEKLVYYFLFPALLFNSITQAPMDVGAASSLFLATCAVLVCGLAAGFLALPMLRPDARQYASIAQCGYRFNTYIGLSLAISMGGVPSQAVMALITGFAVPVANILAVRALARHSGAQPWLEMLKNPLIAATLLALLFNFAGGTVPQTAGTVLTRMGSAAVVLGLLCVGASISRPEGAHAAKLLGWMTVVKLFVTPLGALAIGWAMGLPLLERQVLLLFGALPSASSAYVLTVRMGGDGRLVALATSAGTVLSAFTIPVWLTIGSHL